MKVAIIGTGLMGRGIAEACASSGHQVVLIKATNGSTDRAQADIASSLSRVVSKGKLTQDAADEIMSRIAFSTAIGDAAACELVIESIIEDLATKRALFGELESVVSDTAIVATNTSTLKLSDLETDGLRGRFVGLHFFSPAQVMKLVEVITMPTTREQVHSTATSFVESLGKTAVPAIDSSGFIVNRLLVPYLVHAISAFSQGLGTAPDIDTAMRLGCGHPVGPLALCDLIGLDIVYSMAKLLYAEFGDSCYKPPALLRKLVQDGHLGKKSKLGFYDYSQKPAVENTSLLTFGDRQAA